MTHPGLHAAFLRGVRFLYDEGVFVVQLGHFRAQIDVEDTAFWVVSYDPDSGEITRLTQDEGSRNESPSFSPDGHHIVFTSDRPPKRDKKLYIMDVDGRNQRRTGANIADCEDPAWGPPMGY